MELVRTTTSDGLRLDGCLESSTTSDRAASFDAVLLLHGVGGRFYSGGLFEPITLALREQGLVTLRVNTRGHDSVSVASGPGGPKWQGAAFETVAECVYDVEAWTRFLVELGHKRIAIIGHSLGAIKALYAAAHALPDSVTSIVAASPPRLSYQAFQNGPRCNQFFEAISTARNYVADGQPERLFTARFPFPLLISAASYLDKYGPEERYNFVSFLDQVRVRTLFVYGQQELEQGGVAFAGLPEVIRERQHPDCTFEVATVPGADHFYTGVFDRLVETIVPWLCG